MHIGQGAVKHGFVRTPLEVFIFYPAVPRQRTGVCAVRCTRGWAGIASNSFLKTRTTNRSTSALATGNLSRFKFQSVDSILLVARPKMSECFGLTTDEYALDLEAYVFSAEDRGQLLNGFEPWPRFQKP